MNKAAFSIYVKTKAQINTRNLGFRAKIRKNMYKPVSPFFPISKWAVWGFNYTGVLA